MKLSLDSAGKSFGGMKVFESLSCEFPEGGITAILGPSGCGKTTILKVLSGISSLDTGTVFPAPDSFSKSFVFQEPRLLPRSTCAENIAFALESRMSVKEAYDTAATYLALVGLGSSLDAMPESLSGGMKQRLSLARAFAYPSDILFMDEPFQSLDLKTRMGVMDACVALWKRSDRTVIFVTHDIQEALYLGDRIIVLSDKPSRVLKTIDLPFGHDCRVFGNSDMEQVERELYGLILSASCD